MLSKDESAPPGVGDALWEMSVDMLAVANLEGYLTAVNGGWERVLGYSAQEMTSRPYLDFVHPDDVEKTIAEAQALFDPEHKTVDFENRYRGKDGAYRWLSWSAQQVLGGQDILCIARDVTAQVSVRQDLVERERRYRLVAENATDIVTLVNPAGVITWVSLAAQEVWGYDSKDLVGTSLEDLVHPDDDATAFAIRSGSDRGQTRVVFETRMRTADGQYRWASGVTGPLVDVDGSVVGRIAAIRDTHEEVLARKALAESEHLFHLAMDGAPQGMAVVGLDLEFLQVNPALCTMLGRDEEWLLTHTVADVMHPDDLEAELAGRDDLLAGAIDTEIHERRWVTADGSILWVMHSTGLLRDEAAHPIFYVSHVQDNTHAHHIHEALAHRAHHDPLTGLINRDKLEEHISEILTLRESARGVPALLFCDLDYFKRVNDTHGHATGDEVLVATAERVASALRAGDVVARLGGDEFVVFLTEVPDVATAVVVAEKVRAAVCEPLLIGDGQIDITASVGVALAEADVDARKLLGNADTALYEAKHSGRNRVATFSRELAAD